MKKVKIISLRVHNFKGFGDATFHFEGYDAVVLGGMNGFGKMTVFDAVELLFTGKIARMVEYQGLHDYRLAISDEVLPLVYSNAIDTVSVEAVVEIGNNSFLMQRKARTRDMKNPVDFSAFGGLALIDNGTERILSEADLSGMGLRLFANDYVFLNYLSQEGATSFLKSKDSERARAISDLFNLESYDRPMAQIDKTIAELNSRKASCERRIQDINRMLLTINQVQGQATAYQQICSSEQYWDKENPELSLQQYNDLLRQDGILDGLSYLCKHSKSHRQHRINKYVKRILESDLLKQIVMYAKYKDKELLIKHYSEYKSKLLDMYDSLDSNSASRFDIHLSDDIMQIINKDEWSAFVVDLKNYQAMYKMADKMQTQMVSLYELRDRISDMLYRNRSLAENGECPLCGARYTDADELMGSISNQMKSTRQTISKSQKQIESQFLQIKTSMQRHLVKPLGELFSINGITQDVTSTYLSVDKAKMEQYITLLDRNFDIHINVEGLVEDTVEALSVRLKALIIKEDDTLDYHRMDASYNAFGRYLKKECISEECIEAKRTYLTSLYAQSEIVNNMKAELNEKNVMLGKIDDAIRKVKKMKNELRAQRSVYLAKLLSDIKILFYIYSGRIMQDCRFGRGLFVKENSKTSRILITTGLSPNDEVDALYNMSSGQLVSIAIALKLSLNKLYSDTPFLAIDDPVQTMDDLNLWGFIETMRRDFHDHFLLLSTHEYDYESLLKYKFDKWDIRTLVIDMAKTKNNNG